MLASQILCESYSVTVGNHKSINKRNKITNNKSQKKGKRKTDNLIIKIPHPSCDSSLVEIDSSAIESLGGSEVVHNIFIITILQHTELGKLDSGDLDRFDEVDPVDNLHTPRGGE